MKLYFGAFFCGVIAVLVTFYCKSLNHFWDESQYFKDSSTLVIGILSARENFDQRNAARRTWLKDHLHSKNVRTFFIVGNNTCNTPPEYRIDTFSCTKWNINSSGLQEVFTTNEEPPVETCPSPSAKFNQGFTFQVHHAVVVTKLGILSSLMMPNSKVRIAIMDIQSKEIVVESYISSNQSDSQYGFIYSKTETILLPKNYEGLVIVEGFLKDDSCSKTTWNNGGGVISFKRVYRTPEHLDSLSFSEDLNVAVSVGFYVPEMNDLKKIINAEDNHAQQWPLKAAQLNERLRNEASEMNDIVMVDVIDTYRNLPTKLLKFFEWLQFSQEFSFVMKTDDDSFINIDSILKHLQEDAKFESQKPWIWSKFRKNWPVNYIGKWTDYDYRSSYYPTFPCGSAYILSRKLVEWITANAADLYPYQGEDVSMGIWLTSVNPVFFEDDNFECSSGCSLNSYNRAQLLPGQTKEIWESLKNCESLCGC